MTYAPKFQKQLNGEGATPVPGRTAGSMDCGPRTLLMGVDFQSKGETLLSVTNIRKRMGTPGPQQTNVNDAQKGIESITPKGRKTLRYYKKDHIGDVKSAVKAGKYVHVCIDYGKWNQLMPRTGDPYFTGGHSVGICGYRVKEGEVEWRLYDPLDDQRRSDIARGPRWVPAEAVVKSMEAFAKAKGRCYAGVFGGGQKK